MGRRIKKGRLEGRKFQVKEGGGIEDRKKTLEA